MKQLECRGVGSFSAALNNASGVVRPYAYEVQFLFPVMPPPQKKGKGLLFQPVGAEE